VSDRFVQQTFEFVAQTPSRGTTDAIGPELVVSWRALARRWRLPVMAAGTVVGLMLGLLASQLTQSSLKPTPGLWAQQKDAATQSPRRDGPRITIESRVPGSLFAPIDLPVAPVRLETSLQQRSPVGIAPRSSASDPVSRANRPPTTSLAKVPQGNSTAPESSDVFVRGVIVPPADRDRIPASAFLAAVDLIPPTPALVRSSANMHTLPSPTGTPPTIHTATNSDVAAIEIALARYRAAYEAMDVHLVGAVWPRANRNTLARAFSGLESQRLIFDSCSIDVRDTTATAICSGTALYLPKVGGQGVVERNLEWRFDLEKNDLGWFIERGSAR
jgi:hypothetical protein